MIKPKKFIDSSVGTLDIFDRGGVNFVFIHTAAYLASGQADKIEAMGQWLIEAAKYLRENKKDSGSHRDK